MSISAEEVKKVAGLARIRLSPRDVTKYRTDLSAIIDYNATQLALVKKNFRSTIIASSSLGQEDQVRPSLSQELAISNAPEEKNGFFVVPKLLGES